MSSRLFADPGKELENPQSIWVSWEAMYYTQKHIPRKK
jgi:hypothetical protein